MLVVVTHLLQCSFDWILRLVIFLLDVIKSDFSVLLQLPQYPVLQLVMRHCDFLVVFLNVLLLLLSLYLVVIHQRVIKLASDIHVWFVESPHYSVLGFLLLHLDNLFRLQMQYFRDLSWKHPRLMILRSPSHSLLAKDTSLLSLSFALHNEDVRVHFLILSLKEELVLLYLLGVSFVV